MCQVDVLIEVGTRDAGLRARLAQNIIVDCATRALCTRWPCAVQARQIASDANPVPQHIPRETSEALIKVSAGAGETSRVAAGGKDAEDYCWPALRA